MPKNPLTNVLPEQARGIIYAVVFLALLVLTVWQASNGDWLVFAISLLGSLATLLAASNVNGPATYDGDLPTDTLHGGGGVPADGDYNL